MKNLILFAFITFSLLAPLQAKVSTPAQLRYSYDTSADQKKFNDATRSFVTSDLF